MPRASMSSGNVAPTMAGNTPGWTFGMRMESTTNASPTSSPICTDSSTSATSPWTMAMYLPGQTLVAVASSASETLTIWSAA